jgi:hypothetical protein
LAIRRGKFAEDARPRGPKWLRDALGPDLFASVVILDIEGDTWATNS